MIRRRRALPAAQPSSDDVPDLAGVELDVELGEGDDNEDGG